MKKTSGTGTNKCFHKPEEHHLLGQDDSPKKSTCVYIYTHTCTHIHTRMHIYTRTHAYVRVCERVDWTCYTVSCAAKQEQVYSAVAS